MVYLRLSLLCKQQRWHLSNKLTNQLLNNRRNLLLRHSHPINLSRSPKHKLPVLHLSHSMWRLHLHIMLLFRPSLPSSHTRRRLPTTCLPHHSLHTLILETLQWLVWWKMDHSMMSEIPLIAITIAEMERTKRIYLRTPMDNILLSWLTLTHTPKSLIRAAHTLLQTSTKNIT